MPDGNNLGIDGLPLPPFTLFQPSRYAQLPVVLTSMTTGDQPDGKPMPKQVFWNNHPVTYDAARTCIQTCDAINSLAQARPNDNGWGICAFGSGSCVDDASQARDIVEEARVTQGVFDEFGFLNEKFLQEETGLQCAMFYEDTSRCYDDSARLHFDSVDGRDFGPTLAGAAVALPAGGRLRPQTIQLKNITGILMKTFAVVTAGFSAVDIAEAVRECMKSPVLNSFRGILPFTHPCEKMAFYSPGTDVVAPQRNAQYGHAAAEHRARAIAKNPPSATQRYAAPADTAGRVGGRQWYWGQPGCTDAEKTAILAPTGKYANVQPPPPPLAPLNCDEYANWAMSGGGKANAPSIEWMPDNVNQTEGRKYWDFLQACPDLQTGATVAVRQPFTVTPRPVSSGPTVWSLGHPDLAELLGQLEAELAGFGAPIVRWFRPGLPDDEITRALAAEGLSCPDDLRTWFAWHDGADSSEPGPISDNSLGLGWHTLTLEGALFYYREFWEAYASRPEVLPRSWFPVVILNGTTLSVDTTVPENPPLYIVGDCRPLGTPTPQFLSLVAYVQALIRVYREHLVVADKLGGSAWADPDFVPDPELSPLDRW